MNGDDQPVVNVSWDDVVQYLNWLSVKDGLQPVYEEGSGGWAAVQPAAQRLSLADGCRMGMGRAVRGPDAGPALSVGRGAAAARSLRQLRGRLGRADAADGAGHLRRRLRRQRARSAAITANGYGIFDLGGNVAEWIHDFYTLDVMESTQRVDDPLGPASGALHVVRGASWRSATVTDLRVAARGSGSDGREDVGFRIARNLQ